MAKKKYCYTSVTPHRGHNIPSHPLILIRVSQTVMKNIIDAQMDTGLSIREILEYSGKPCECCKDTNVLVYNKKDEAVQIKRGILSKRK